jgi:isoleucyl-tRNA synthetase
VRRRSSQTVLSHVLLQLAVLMSPLVPHLAEEVWQNIPFTKNTTSIFQNLWISSTQRYSSYDEEFWNNLRKVRNDVNKCMESARQAKEIGASMECKVYLHTSDEAMAAKLFSMQGDTDFLPDPITTNGVDDLRFILMASQVSVCENQQNLFDACKDYFLTADSTESGFSIGVKRASGKKCSRCWYYSELVGEDENHDICPRCNAVVKIDNHII